MERVFITGIGAVTPLGLNAPATWAAMLEGRSGIDTIAAFDPSPFPVRIAGEVRGFEPRSGPAWWSARRSVASA
jgi:3-oxoacyl-[acyl-carrier-protein] synthase II